MIYSLSKIKNEKCVRDHGCHECALEIICGLNDYCGCLCDYDEVIDCGKDVCNIRTKYDVEDNYYI